MFKLVIATHNPGKFDEMHKHLSQLLPNFKILSLNDLKITDEPEETGKTFEENAKLRAEFYGNLTQLPCVADDGGIMIDALDGEPGIISGRWLGKKSTDKKLVDYCIRRMDGIPIQRRTARFKTSLYFFNPYDNKHLKTVGTIEGSIALKPSKKIIPGYQYRSVFIVAKFKKLYIDLTPQEHDQINHRLHAMKLLARRLKSWYN